MSESIKRTFSSNLFWFLSGIASGITIAKLIGHPGQEDLKRNSENIAPSETHNPIPGLNNENAVHQRVIDSKDAEIARLHEKTGQLVNEYHRLQDKYHLSVAETEERERIALFRTLEPTLMQLNILAADLQSGMDVPSKITLGLIQKLPQKLTDIGIEMPETIGQVVAFDPEHHVPLPTQTGLIKPGEAVVVITPGFSYNQQVLTRSEVQKVNPENG